MNDSIEATPITEAEQKRRADYVAGLRALADILEANPGVKLPFPGSDSDVTISLLSVGDPRAEMAKAARAFPIKWDKAAWGGETAYLSLRGKLRGLRMEICAYREAVCERVVTGIEDREVEEEVQAAVTRTVVKPVEIVEWICSPIMAAATPAQTETDAA